MTLVWAVAWLQIVELTFSSQLVEAPMFRMMVVWAWLPVCFGKFVYIVPAGFSKHVMFVRLVAILMLASVLDSAEGVWPRPF